MKNKHFLFLSLTLMGLISVTAQNLHTHANATSFENESNSITGWVTSGVIASSDNTEAQHGNYSLRLETSANNSRNIDYYFNAIVGAEYQIRIWAKQGLQSADPAFAGWTGLSGSSTTVIGTTTWTEYSWTVTATVTNPKIRIFSGSSGGGAVGDVVYIDNVSIVSTSTPTITTNYGIGSGTQGINNTFYGTYAGAPTSGSQNTFVGGETGRNTTTGNENTFLGYHSGYTNISGSGNVFIGNKVGYNETGNDKLYIDNSDTSTPLLYGNFATDQLGINTNVIPSGYTFAVKGKMIAEEIKVQVSPWSDFVFYNDYNLPTLTEVEEHIKTKGHLQDIPSAEEVKKNGIQLGEMNAKLLQKIEELVLYTIQQEKEIKALKHLKKENEALKKRMDNIENLLSEINK